MNQDQNVPPAAQTEPIGQGAPGPRAPQSPQTPQPPQDPRATRGEESLDDLLKELVSREGSDLHLKVGRPPILRIHGNLVELSRPPLTREDMTRLLHPMLGEDRVKLIDSERELDMAYSVAGLARFRVNVFHQKNHLGAVLRVIPFDVLTIDQLGLPAVVEGLCKERRGMMLVTGPTGSGKSTTLAAMVNHINENRACHIMTIEDPIEFLHRDKKAAVNQRELGTDTLSFSSALRHILRQSPDVILVGELRDLETISLALSAAETGHLVLATLHTTDAAQTIDRIIDVFPPDEQSQVRLQLSNSLKAVVSQTLVPLASGDGRKAAFEILLCYSGVQNLIREGKTHQIYNLIQTGSQYGMKLLDASLAELVRSGVVTFEEAIAKASNPSDFETLCKSAAMGGRTL